MTSAPDLPTADRFTEDDTDQFVVDGHDILAMVSIEVGDDATVRILRVAANEDRRQGVVIDADAPLHLGGAEATRIVLWADTAPDEVEVPSVSGTLRVWNTWETDGIAHAWIGWAGIRTEGSTTDPDGMMLRCTDGNAPGDSVDLELRILVLADDPDADAD